MSFILFVYAICTTLLLFILLADVVADSTVHERTLELCNTYQLPIFLFANVLTGVINMCIPTIYISHIYAFSILCIYMSIIIAFAWLLGSIYEHKQRYIDDDNLARDN